MIETDRLFLTPRVVDLDIPREVEWLNDPYIMKYSEQRHTRHTIGSQIAYITSFPYGMLMGIKCRGILIGSISATVDRHNKVANLGILIGDVFYWEQGYGSEAWIAFSDWIVRNYKVRKLEAGCMETNISMVKICGKAGMTEEGRKKEHFIHEGLPYDRLEFGKVIR